MDNIELNENYIETAPNEEAGFSHNKSLNSFKNSDGSIIRVGKKVMYYTPKQQKRRRTKLWLTGCALAVLGTVTVVLRPVITQSFKELIAKLELKYGPERKEINDDLIPENVNESELLTETKSDEYLTLSPSALVAIDNLTAKINNLFEKYSDLEGALSPAFVIINYENQIPTGFKLFCDLDQNRFISFEFSISNTEAFEALLESGNMEVTDIINGFNQSLINRELLDSPTVGTKAAINGTVYYISDIMKKFEGTGFDEEDNLVYEEFYNFNTYCTKGTRLSQEMIRIKKTDAEKLEDFNPDDITSLCDIYLDDTSKFEKTGTLDLGKDKISVILISAKQTSKNIENNLEQ